MSEETPKGKVKNPQYVEFLKGGFIKTIPKEDFIELLDQVKHEQLAQARTLVILLWMTGARPNEVLSLTSDDVGKSGNQIVIRLIGSKGGKPRTFLLPLKEPLVKEVWVYCEKYYKIPGFVFFYSFVSRTVRHGTTRVFWKKNRQTNLNEKISKFFPWDYPVLSKNLFYWFYKWFGLPPYYFRHNRLTIAAKTESIETLRLIKGAKTNNSVFVYLHQTKGDAKRIAKALLK